LIPGQSRRLFAINKGKTAYVAGNQTLLFAERAALAGQKMPTKSSSTVKPARRSANIFVDRQRADRSHHGGRRAHHPKGRLSPCFNAKSEVEDDADLFLHDSGASAYGRTKSAKHDRIFVYGHIRSGRAAVGKSRMITLMARAVGDAAKAENSSSVWVYVAELPPRQMIEFGRLLPEAGDEPAWTAALPAEDREFMPSIGK
jgi:hypothetical protein